MSTPKLPQPVKLITSVIYQAQTGGDARPAHLTQALAAMENLFGPFDLVTPAAAFTYTHYYQREMGEYLERLFLSFSRLVPRDCLPATKLATNAIELDLAEAGRRRRVNLDPGLLTLENLVLATGKNFTHRLYLGQGIFGEVTLLFRDGQYQILPWTYPDYAGDEVRALLLELRGRLQNDYRRGAGMADSALPALGKDLS